MKIIIMIICLLMALLVHLFFDLHKQKVKKPIIHWLSALLVFLTSIGAGVLNQAFLKRPIEFYASLGFSPDVWSNVLRFAFFSIMVHLVFFDPLWNLGHSEAWNYHGSPENPKQAWTDKIWSEIPPLGELFFRTVFLILGFCVWFSWDKIIQGGWLDNS